MKMLIAKDGHKFLVKETNKDYHCQFGVIKKEDLSKKDGTIVKTNKGIELALLTPDFRDLFSKIKRGAQIIPLKDMAVILAKTGINKKSIVVDAGIGSGALCCFLAYYAKKVTSYDIREDHYKIGMHNKELLGLKNLNLKIKNIYEGIDEKNIDVITLDLPEPWEVIPHLKGRMKTGGYIVAYSPTIPQVMDFVGGINKIDGFTYLETIEIIERGWEVKHRKVRPNSRIIAHSGFLTFVRKTA